MEEFKLQRLNEDIETLTNRKIPELEDKVRKLEEEYNEKQMELASVKTQLELPRKKFQVTENVISDSTLLDQYIIEIKNSKEDIEKYRSRIITVPSGISREEAEAEIVSGKAENNNIIVHGYPQEFFSWVLIIMTRQIRMSINHPRV
ncbi:unnamed protein product [Acanthoscelides obtectus]|uniref:Uncharacterized protein n=1 Tax=Acanthoscelides obtectus TaxID=200917 RepID=A0A9P0QBC3_ACAOB|nr:unnamed protein product [Acanthoscelides obtectus]CAK1687494.1 hypothetical protein AOBTE_LOCUS36270 [Acanthoscelides obtectus]